MSSSWGEAYFRQAESDFRVMCMLRETGGLPKCHALHYMQMTMEKLSKAFVRDAERRRVHRFVAALRALHVFESSKTSADRRGRRRQVRKWGEIVRKRGALLERIERLAPSESMEGPNAEYPWPTGASTGAQVVAPVEYHFQDLELHSPGFLRLMGLAEMLLAEGRRNWQ